MNIVEGINQRKEAMNIATKDTMQLVDRVANEQQAMIASARQLMVSLSQIPDIKQKDAAKATSILRKIHNLNPDFTNIFIADRSGTVWATAVPTRPPFIVSDRRYFKNALVSRQLSSGEYIISRAINRPTFNLGYPLKDEHGDVVGVISVGFLLEKYTQLLERSKLPKNANIVFFDHKGIILSRSIEPERFIGKQSDPALFKQVQEAPDESTSVVEGVSSGDERILSSRKLRLAGETSPYMYVRVEIPVESALAHANTHLVRNLVFFSLVLILAYLFSSFIGVRSIVARIRLLDNASQNLADGNYQIKVADLVKGGELGRLAESFDSMAHKLVQREEALASSERFLKAIIDSEPECIKMLDADCNLLLMNKAGLEIIEADSFEQVKGQCVCTLITEPHRDSFFALTKQVFQGIPGTLEFETIGLKGHHVWLETHAVPFCNEQGKIVALLGITRNITGSKQAEKDLHQAKIAAELANTTKSRFLATMSHEIRTPMNGVIGMIELLQHTELTPEQYEYAAGAKSSGIELVHLLNDILDLSKIEADKIELEQSDINLQSVISDTINLMSLQAREKGVKLTSSIDTEVPISLKGDAGRLRQILTNLIGNAIKFSPKGAVTLNTKKVTEDEQSVTLRFLVRDTGIGIAADKLEHIFEPFTQADSSTTRTYGGTGLGLSICKRLAELMGGSIGVESTEGEGSTFWFTVVMEKQMAGEAGQNIFPVSIKHVVSPHPKMPAANGIRILLTEDDPTAQAIVPKLLKIYGYLVDVACDGKEALQALETNDYALVLMDIMMPEMNGYEVTAVIRDPSSAVRRHDIPIIALTGNDMKQDHDRCIAAGMDDHLPKPLLLPDLIAMLAKWLNV